MVKSKCNIFQQKSALPAVYYGSWRRKNCSPPTGRGCFQLVHSHMTPLCYCHPHPQPFPQPFIKAPPLPRCLLVNTRRYTLHILLGGIVFYLLLRLVWRAYFWREFSQEQRPRLSSLSAGILKYYLFFKHRFLTTEVIKFLTR